MPVVIAISSYVASGSVGLRAAHAVFERTPNRLISLPTVFLSAHLGHPDVARHDIPSDVFTVLLDRVRSQTSDEPVAGVLTGFQPTRRHAELTAAFVTHVKQQWPACRVLVDPILGDDPDGLYVATDAAEGIRDDLVPIADIITPNRFELAWLTQSNVSDVASAVMAAARTKVPTVFATSIPARQSEIEPSALSTLVVNGGQQHIIEQVRVAAVAHGTGDLLSALLLQGLIVGETIQDALTRTTEIISARLRASGKSLDIDLSSLTER